MRRRRWPERVPGGDADVGVLRDAQLLCAAVPTLALRFAAMRYGSPCEGPQAADVALELTRLRKEATRTIQSAKGNK